MGRITSQTSLSWLPVKRRNLRLGQTKSLELLPTASQEAVNNTEPTTAKSSATSPNLTVNLSCLVIGSNVCQVQVSTSCPTFKLRTRGKVVLQTTRSKKKSKHYRVTTLDKEFLFETASKS